MHLKSISFSPSDLLKPTSTTTVTMCKVYQLSIVLVKVPAIIREFDDIIVVGRLLCCHDHFEERIWALFSINNHLPTEKPVATVFTVIVKQTRVQSMQRVYII